MNARLTAYPDCGDEYALTLARAASDRARREGWELSPWDFLELAASVLPRRPDLAPPGVTLSKVIDRYVTLRKAEGLDHTAAVRTIRRAIESAMPVAR